ncbi:hypothetical protein BC938DRAFT_479995 [Jimgerdemannia flammicorona]|uniref:Uncharacterized protein n=1 Tax=Jimgerdemannia flammicorona TaxID=994334 RepID=A0A433QJM9_9FUNG|nr:hypothetical protein BC938DRAFT_479995 [Jimgerdemannia flammicorona]
MPSTHIQPFETRVNAKAQLTHPAAGRGGKAGDEGDDGFGVLAGQVVLDEELSSLLLGGAADFADEDDAWGKREGGLMLNVWWYGDCHERRKRLQTIDIIRPVKRVPSNPNAQGLPEPDLSGLPDSLVGKRSGARDDADLARAVDMAWHDTDLALIRSDDARTVGADQTCCRLREKGLLDLLVM